MWKTVLFDLDGTLLDYAKAQEEAVLLGLSELGLDDVAGLVAPLLAFVNSDPVQAIEACRPGAPGTTDPCVASVFPPSSGLKCSEFLDAYYRALSLQGQTIPDAAETLSLVHSGASVGVISNGLGPVQRTRLERSGLMQYIDALVISCEIGSAKPDPAIFHAAMRLLGSRPGETVMVGDGASSDMRGAEAAGIAFVWFRSGGDFGGDGPRIAEITRLSGLMDSPGFDT